MGAELNKALVAAQAEMRNPRLTSVNPHFRNRYADLAEVRECVMPVLAKHGLALVQSPVCTADGAGVNNLLCHHSGELLDLGDCILPLAKKDPQAAGSAITYARRYSLQAIAGVVGDEDDDAEGATGRATVIPFAQAKPQQSSASKAAPTSSTAGTGSLKFEKQIKSANTMADLIEVAKFLEKEPQAVKDAHRQLFRETQAKLEKK